MFINDSQNNELHIHIRSNNHSHTIIYNIHLDGLIFITIFIDIIGVMPSDLNSVHKCWAGLGIFDKYRP